MDASSLRLRSDTKAEINKRRREYYAANKEQINKRRRELYAEKKKLTTRKNKVNQTTDVVDSSSKLIEISEDGHKQKDGSSTSLVADELLSNLQRKQTLTTTENELRLPSNGLERINKLIKNREKDHGQKLNDATTLIAEELLSSIRDIDATTSTTSLIKFSNAENESSSILRDQTLLQQTDFHPAKGSFDRDNSFTSYDERTLLLPKVPPCKHCGAYKFYGESTHFCCSNGAISLTGSVLPEYLVQLITGNDEKSKNFQNMIRTYNNSFAFTSIGISCDEQYERRDRGIYTVRVQGQIHHYLDDLIPQNASRKLSGIQFYFYDPDHQVTNRMMTLPRLDASIVEELVELLKQNPYSEFLRRASELENVDQYHIVIRADPGLDQRTYNLPTSMEVAGIWTEDESGESDNSKLWDIRVYTKSGTSYKVQYFYGCYDPLQYVLMFPKGETGWHGKIAKVGCSIRRKQKKSLSNCDHFDSFADVIEGEEQGVSRSMFEDVCLGDDFEYNGTRTSKRTTVSCREYYVYKLQIRENDKSYLLRFGRLLQQYVIDNYIKIESMRLSYLKRNQKKTRTEYYQGIIDSVISGVPIGGKVGKRTYLPPSFIGGPRHMRHRYLDSMALVQEFGRPDLFVTMTCNPNWPEIKEHLQPGEEAHNRPDLLARIFKAKLSIMHDKIMSGDIFGKIASVVHVIEFQKRGLPHAHFLIILKPAFKYMTPEAYDRVVCAELPDQSADPYFYSLVVKHMMHGPCGDLNPANVCMKKEKCKNHYPKEYAEYTSHGKGSYPIYRRRDDKRTAKVRGKILDNRWVIPYNPTLLLLFNCHINVEICCDIRAVKYLYKYVHKGHDKVMFRIVGDASGSDVDEISNFQKARWVSPVEAVWRIFGFSLHGMYPSVLQLQVHMPNFQTVHFEDDTDLQELLQDERNKQTMLTEFFRINANVLEAKQLNLLYKEFPKYYVWDSQARTWMKRKKGVVIGRLCTVNPVENERYYLRILLSNVRCPTSFEYLLSVGGIVCDSFQEAAHRRGLLQNDDDIDKAMEEASIYRMPSELRRLFATLLYYCRPSNAKKLFQTYYEQMAEDFIKLQDQLKLSDKDIQYKVLQGINDTLESLGRDVNEYHLVSFKYVATEFERYTREITSEKNIPIPEEDLHAINKLNVQQKIAFDVIFHHAMLGIGGVFFVDGPGGTGKSFLYKVLLAHIRSKDYIGIIVASSGIASSEFLGGRTAHSRFKIPIDATPGMKCQISFQSSEADLIRNSKIIIWDEAPMADKSAIFALNKLLQELCENSEAFGGKLVVFGGDFRQVLPVVRGGGRTEQIEASIVSSSLWPHFNKIELTDNMRAREDPTFIEYLMRIGNGEEPVNSRDEIKIPKPMLITYTSLEQSIEALISCVYPDMKMFEKSAFEMMKRGILCPKNEFVDDINSRLIMRMPGKEFIYISDDRAKNACDQGDYIDYLNSLEPRGLPPHRLIFKVNSPVMLLRNINPVEGLCNGTRLICKYLTPNVVGAIIATGQFCGKLVWIPRIPLEPNPSENKYCIPFIRRQIPLRLCFAMTINKSQGQTFDFVGIYLRQPVFTHGQLYVAMSRAKSGKNVKILIVPPICNDPETRYTTNVVYKEVLAKARLI